MADPLNPEELRFLLLSLEANESMISPNRARIRADVLASYDQAVEPISPMRPQAETVEAISPTKPQAEIIELVDRQQDRPPIRRRGLVWAAAALLLITLVGSMATLANGHWLTAADGDDNGDHRLVPEGTALPADLAPGPQVSNAIGWRLSFDAPEGMSVLRESEGRIVLSDSDRLPATSRIVVTELATVDLERMLRDLDDEGRINLKELTATVGDETTSRWDVSITNDEIITAGCSVGSSCLSLYGAASEAPAELWAGAENRITLIGESDETMVVMIEQSRTFSGPISRMASQILATLELDFG